MFAVVGKCVFKKASVSTYEFSLPISLHFLTKLVERIDKRLKHFPLMIVLLILITFSVVFLLIL